LKKTKGVLYMIKNKYVALVIIVISIFLITFIASFIYEISHPETVFENEYVSSSYTQVEKDMRTDDEKKYDLMYNQTSAQADYSYIEGKTTILLLGIDESQEREGWGYFRTDTIIVLTIDFENNSASMISIPRDSLVYIHGYGGKARVNKAFSQGGGYNKNGFEYVMKTVSNMMGGIPISQYVCVDMEVLKDIVDRMGGVDFYVDVEVDTSDAHINVGQRHLWGYQVLAYCRQRKGSSDIARIDRQQKMLAAIFTQLKEQKIMVYLPTIYEAVAEDMYTNLTMKQISALSIWAMDFELENLQRFSVPGDYLHIGEGSYWGIKQTEFEEIIESLYGVDVSLNRYNDIYYVRGQVDQYNLAVSRAMGLRSSYTSYIQANRAYISDSQYYAFFEAINAAEAIAGTVSLTDPAGKAEAISAKSRTVISMYNTLSAQIEAAKAAAATPTPATPTPATPTPATPTPATPTPATPTPATPTPATPTPSDSGTTDTGTGT